MFFYVVVFLVVAALGAYISERERAGFLKRKHADIGLAFLVLLLILVVVAGIRGVGADFGNYMRLYHNVKITTAEGLWKSLINLKEPLYKLLCIIASWIYDDPVTMFILCAILTVCPIVWVTYKETHNFFFAIVLYVMLVWVDSFGAIRQALSSAFVVMSFPYLMRRKFWKYLICVLIASMFHVTSLVMLPMYFVLSRKVSILNTAIIAIVSVVVRYSYDFIFDILEVYKGKDIEEFSYMTSDVNIFRILVAFAPIALFLFLPKKTDIPHISDEEAIDGVKVSRLDVSINIVLINAALMFSTMGSAYLARVGIFTVAFFPIAIPEIIRRYDRKSHMIIMIIMALAYFAYWMYGINAQGLSYITIFQRP